VLEIVFETEVQAFWVVGTRIENVFIGSPVLFAVLGSSLAPQQSVQVSLVVLGHRVILSGKREVGSISHQIRKDLVLFDDPKILHVVFVKPLEEVGHGQKTGQHVIAGEVESVLVEEHESAVDHHTDLMQLKDEPSCKNTADAVVVSDTLVIGIVVSLGHV
jgi:hypothetical protein